MEFIPCLNFLNVQDVCVTFFDIFDPGPWLISDPGQNKRANWTKTSIKKIQERELRKGGGETIGRIGEASHNELLSRSKCSH